MVKKTRYIFVIHAKPDILICKIFLEARTELKSGLACFFNHRESKIEMKCLFSTVQIIRQIAVHYFIFFLIEHLICFVTTVVYVMKKKKEA